MNDNERKDLDFGHGSSKDGTKVNKGYQPEKGKQVVPKPPVVKPVIKKPEK